MSRMDAQGTRTSRFLKSYLQTWLDKSRSRLSGWLSSEWLPEDWRARLTMGGASLVVFGTAVMVRDHVGVPAAWAQTPAQRTAPATAPSTSAPSTSAAGAPAAGKAAAAPNGEVAPGQRPTIPETVAVVNQQRITKAQLGQQCLERYGAEVLESLVNKHLIMQECQRKQIVISPQDIDREIETTAQRFNLSVELWMKMLQEERHINPERYRQDIIWPMLALRKLAADRLVVAPEQLQQAFESEYGAKVQVRMIATAGEAKAKEVLAKAKADPTQFGMLAKEHSEDANSAAARGLIPPIRRHLGEPEVEQAVFALKEGEISPIVQVHGQYLIFKCERHLPPTHIAPQHRKQAEERLKQMLVDENLRSAATDMFAELQKNAKVVNVYNDAELSKKYPGVAALVNDKPVQLSFLVNECLVRYAVDVLEGEIRYTLLSQAMKQQNVAVSETDIQAEINRAAESFGYLKPGSDQPDVERWLKSVTEEEGLQVKHYVRDAVWPTAALKKLVQTKIDVTEDDLVKGFEANYGPRVEVLACVCANQRVAQEVWDLARKNPTKAYFGQLASQYSVEPVSRANLGEVPPIQRHSGQPSLENAAFELSQNELISGIVAVGDTYVIMYYLGRTQPVVTNPADVREVLTKDLFEKKLRLAMAEKYEDLKSRSQIDNFLTGSSQSPVSTARRDQAVKPAGANAPVDKPAGTQVLPLKPPAPGAASGRGAAPSGGSAKPATVR